LTKRRRSRESALQVLYQWELSRKDGQIGLAHFGEHFSLKGQDSAFLERIVQGVLEHFEEMGQLIEKYSEHWRLSRIAPIDRAILRMAIFELLYCDDIPPKATLNEAVDLGKRYGSDNSGAFINGILDRIMHERLSKPAE